MSDATPTRTLTRKNPEDKYTTRFTKASESIESMNRCEHRRWWNTTTETFTMMP
jgi:hypothetical protein